MKRIIFILTLVLPFAASGAEDLNVTLSPDGKKEAFTRNNDLWIRDVASGTEIRVTNDGSSTILNGYASWVYYEEILGRQSRYRAFWWSPDSRRLAFYRFDDSRVPEFPIYSPFGQDGSLKYMRYPKVEENNPEVRVGIADLKGDVVWVDFEEGDQYFGKPFWRSNGLELFVQRMPRRQNQLAIYKVDPLTGKTGIIYTERNDTWVDMIDDMYFGRDGIYAVRDYEGWDQIYLLSYDGVLRRQLTWGNNWDMRIVRVDDKRGDIWFLARKDNPLHPTLYRVDRNKNIITLTDAAFFAGDVKFSEDGKTFDVRLSTASVPWRTLTCEARSGTVIKTVDSEEKAVEDAPKPEIVSIENGGHTLYGLVSYPRGFNSGMRCPVIMTVYGGPGNSYVRDKWEDRDATDRWCYENGIIYMVVDPRSAGQNGRKGKDEAFGRVGVVEQDDYVAWAEYMQSKPYVIPDRIGVTGFSFGGTMTAWLVLRHSEYFCCGIAGGGVYDWSLYDSIYTERFMDVMSENPEGYWNSSVLSYLNSGAVDEKRCGRLRLTHGTGDDNVHCQNTLRLADALQKAGVQFEMMLYPDGKHGYRNEQRTHDIEASRNFWKSNLLK